MSDGMNELDQVISDIEVFKRYLGDDPVGLHIGTMLDVLEARKKRLWIQHLEAEVARKTEMAAEIAKAAVIYRDASIQSHSSHFDSTQQGGKGCPECIRANKMREQADEIMKGVMQ